MDIVKIPIEGNQYFLEITKNKRVYSITPFGQYLITITFKDYIGNIVLQFNTNEKEYFNMIQSMNYFSCNLGTILSDVIHFESSTPPYYIYIFALEETYSPTPSEDDPRLGISIFQGNENNQGSINRLYIEMTYFNLEEFIYQLYTLIDDIPYLDEINNSFIEDIFDKYNDVDSFERYLYNMYRGEFSYDSEIDYN